MTMTWCAAAGGRARAAVWQAAAAAVRSLDTTTRMPQKSFIPKLGHRKDVLKANAKIAAGGGGGGGAATAPATTAAGLGPEAVSVVVGVPAGGGGGDDTPYTYVLLLRRGGAQCHG